MNEIMRNNTLQEGIATVTVAGTKKSSIKTLLIIWSQFVNDINYPWITELRTYKFWNHEPGIKLMKNNMQSILGW